MTFVTPTVTSTSNINIFFPNTIPYQPPANMPRFYAIFTRVYNLSQSPQKPISISINNYLLSICLRLDLIEDEDNKLRILLDTGATMNSNNLSYLL